MRPAARYLVLALVLMLLIGIVPVSAQTDKAQAHKAAVKSALAQVSSGNPDALNTLFSGQYMANEGGVALQETTLAETEAFVNALHGAIPDLLMTPTAMIAQGDEVAAEIAFSGTFSQPLNFPPTSPDPVPPTNKAVLWTEMDFAHFNDAGLISEMWTLSDPTVMLTQLGIMPPQEIPPTGTPVKTPTGYQALSADDQSATLTSGMDDRNLGSFKEQSALGLGTFTQYYTDPYIAWSRGNPFLVTVSDAQQAGQFVDAVRQALPDNATSLNMVVTEGDWVAAIGTVTGTFTQDTNLFGSPLTHTNKQIVWQAGILDRYARDGKIAEEWFETDTSPLLAGTGADIALGFLTRVGLGSADLRVEGVVTFYPLLSQ